MTTVTEATTNKKLPLGSTLASGVEFLSANQTVTFNLYKKMVLPLDGFVFWINANLITPAPIFPKVITIDGSLHYSTESEQEESSTVSVNTIVFTALEPCDIFNSISPQYLYIATYRGIRFTFNSQGKYYQQADLWHYVGVAYKAIHGTQIIDDPNIDLWHYVGVAYKAIHGTQIIDDPNILNSLSPLIVSNSLPIWLGMPSYVPPYPGFTCPIPLMYPSFLVDSNEPPPYASVHIEDTRALEAVALLDRTLTSSQLTSETVRITTYGIDNDHIITFLNFVMQYSNDWNYIGIMNMPIINDLKEPHSELQIISQKKEIVFKVSYVQQSVRNIARQLIQHTLVHFQVAHVTVTPHEDKAA